jgi:hypothetical protein
MYLLDFFGEIYCFDGGMLKNMFFIKTQKSRHLQLIRANLSKLSDDGGRSRSRVMY